MAITGYNRPSAGIPRFASGSLIDTGTVKKSIIDLGFVPKYVQVVNATDRITYEWYEGMAAGTSLKTVAAGTRTLDTGDAAITVGEINSGTVGTWTVYEQTTNTVGTPSVAPAEKTDNSRLNEANEVFVGFTIAAAVAISSKQLYWQAWG